MNIVTENWDEILQTREFDSFIFQNNLTGLIKPAFFMSNFLLYFIVLYSILF